MRRTILALLLAATPLLAQTPYLVSDINTIANDSPSSSLPYGFFRFGSRVIFAARGQDGRVKLWTTDGTAGGTALFVDLPARTDVAPAPHFAVLNGKLFFNATDSAHGEELWVTDGTAAGTRLFADINPGFPSSQPGDRIVDRGKLIFEAFEGLDGAELWITDGTPAGTTLLKDLVPGTAGSNPRSFVVVNDTVYFSAGGGLWKTDGTAAGTLLVKSVIPFVSSLPEIAVVGSRIFLGAATALWVSDGTEAGTQKIADFVSAATTMTPFGDKVLFAATDASHGTELWISDGTSAGTHMVRDIAPGTDSSYPSLPVVLGNAAYFSASTTADGQQLWRTDGTAAGTAIVKSIAPRDHPGGPSGIVAAGNSIDFAYSAGTAVPVTLWISDGTANGTRELKPDGKAVAVYVPIDKPPLTVIDGIVYFGGSNGLNGIEPWRSDGTDAGTFMLSNLLSDAGPSSFPQNLVAAGDQVFFDAWDGLGQPSPDIYPLRSLWRSDGTAAGTIKLLDLPGGLYPGFQVVGNSIYFMERGELWTSDGTPNGTARTNELLNRFPNRPSFVTAAGDRVFADVPGFFDFTLWATSIAPGSPAVPLDVAGGFGFTDIGGPTAFFTTDFGRSSLWITDGTTAGTRIGVPDIDGRPANILYAAGSLYFTVNAELWKSVGSVEGTSVVTTFASLPTTFVAAAKNLFFFVGEDLWVSDGTDAGTRFLATAASQDLAALGDRAVFAGRDAASGLEPWVSDGTPEGTKILRDIFPGAPGSYPAELRSLAGLVYFNAFDGVHGVEPWVTDGTPEGTTLVADIEPGTADSKPQSFVKAGERIFFTANTRATGRELWALPLGPAPRLRVADIRVAEGDAGTTARFTVTLMPAPARGITVDYATSDGSAHAGSDYDAASGTLTFAAGETSKSIDVHVRGDAVPGNDRTFFITLKNAAGVTLEKPVAFAVIADDDQFADVGLALDFSLFRSLSVFATASNAGPRIATDLRIASTTTPASLSASTCAACSKPPSQLAPGASARAFEYRWPGLQYHTATISARQRDPQPANNSVAWISNNFIAMDALYLTPGGQANVWISYFGTAANVSVSSSDPSVISVPASVTNVPDQPLTFVARGVAPGTATIRVVTGATTTAELPVTVVVPGTPLHWPGGITYFIDNQVAFDQPATVTIETGGSAPYNGEHATGVVTVTEGGRELGRLTLTQSLPRQWKLPVYATGLGANTLTVSYAGDANFLPVSGPATVTTTQGSATIAGSPQRVGTAATVHITVTGSPAAAPSGTITVSEPGAIAPKQVTLTASSAAGVAEADVALTNVAPGLHTLVVGYSGDARYKSGTQNVRMPDPKPRAVRH